MKLNWPEWMRSWFAGRMDRSGVHEYGFSQADRIIHRLDLFMMKRKPFLQSRYTLRQLSEDIGFPAYQISAIIHLRKRMNFSEYLNKLRIQHCKRLIHASSGRKVNIRDLLVASGFHRRSTFNNAFKKFTGFTPSEYIKLNW